jgi:acetyl-CoA acetyltransferase
MKAYIPYGGYWSTPFVKWQGEFAHLHAIEFAAHVSRKAIAARGWTVNDFDYAAYGLTVPQARSFYGLPWFTGMLGAHGLTGPTISQACATGARLIADAAGAIATGGATAALLVSGDRVSNGPHVYYPAPASPGGTGVSENIILDGFANDPNSGSSMVGTAENVARREGIATAEQHEVVLARYDQYQDALKDDRAFQKRYMDAVFEIPDASFRKTVMTIEGDVGVYHSTADKIASLKPVAEGGTVTFAGQTHPADGSAAIVVVSTPERARELSSRQGPLVEIVGYGQGRADRGFMPAAPTAATRRVLETSNLSIHDMDAIKSHNPFAVNDIAFARAMGIDWKQMNNYGCSLIWGHPQGPTGLRSIIELIEELEIRGGGYGLFQGCAAGDSAMAVIVKVS